MSTYCGHLTTETHLIVDNEVCICRVRSDDLGGDLHFGTAFEGRILEVGSRAIGVGDLVDRLAESDVLAGVTHRASSGQAHDEKYPPYSLLSRRVLEFKARGTSWRQNEQILDTHFYNFCERQARY